MNKSRIAPEILSPIFILIILMAFHLAACRVGRQTPQNQVCFEKNCVEVEIVQKEADVQRGLQGREYLDPKAGMLFVFPESRRYSFWMKETLIPLDMIWMDYARRVVFIAADVPPCRNDPCPTYTPSSEAMYVLETNAGYAQKNSIKVGAAAEFRNGGHIP